jgi:hypothetical protein
MEAAYLPLLLAATSAALYLAGTRRMGLRRSALVAAASRALEFVGLTLGLAAVNVAVGVAVVLAVRWATGSFVSLYLNTDGTLLPLSALQAAVFHGWMESRDAKDP